MCPLVARAERVRPEVACLPDRVLAECQRAERGLVESESEPVERGAAAVTSLSSSELAELDESAEESPDSAGAGDSVDPEAEGSEVGDSVTCGGVAVSGLALSVTKGEADAEPVASRVSSDCGVAEEPPPHAATDKDMSPASVTLMAFRLFMGTQLSLIGFWLLSSGAIGDRGPGVTEKSMAGENVTIRSGIDGIPYPCFSRPGFILHSRVRGSARPSPTVGAEELTHLVHTMYVMAYAWPMSAVTITAARANLYRLVDQVNDEAEPLTITGQRGNAVLVGEDDWRAIQETLFLEAVPGMVDSIREARAEGIEAGSEDVDW